MSQPISPAEPQNTSALGKAYEPKAVESHWYEVWNQAGYFSPSKKGNPYVIVIPPPNVTGSLHMGHALNQTLQDAITRYRRMTGDAALWVPGTDHGGIATQNVVEKILMKEGTSRHAMGREKFLERMWAWRGETGDTILMQSKRLGASFDLSKNRFTMDDQCSRAVRYAFVELFKRKLLYRGKRLVNWCPRCSTALADIEVEHRDAKGSLWHIRYPIVDRRQKPRVAKKVPGPFELGYAVVATTRPETLLGDTAVAVNPKDKRYKDLVGSRLKLPLTGREIPVVADAAIDKTFGSGAVKVTPAHDPTDFEIAERQKLPHITVIGFDGKMTEAAGDTYKDQDRFEARKNVVAALEAAGLLDKIEDYKVSLAVCYRCDSVIEPLESEQWFLSMADMAKRAREANKKGKVRIVPESWESPYQLWLRNLKDWCVSRQIWWGHRIPVWYCVSDEKGQTRRTDCPPISAMEDPTICPACKNTKLEQDPDVLDTWFSSALWPMSVFGWPDQTADLERFYPTTTLVTGHEILYLWVARMIMFGQEFMGKVPFKYVLIHGIVRDKGGRKMSKSIGNVIDPLELIEEYGADAVRFSLAQSAAPGRDMQISKENFIATRNFCNKIWNATRFALMNLEGLTTVVPISSVAADLDLSDRWILHRYNQTVKETTEALDRFDIDAASRGLYNFFWSDFCDWYLELIKPRVDRVHYAEFPITPGSTTAAKTVLATVLEGSIKLLHPFVPFLTEEIWSKLPKTRPQEHVMVAEWPKAQAAFDDADAAREMEMFQEVVTKLRAIRSEMGIPPGQRIQVVARTSGDPEKFLRRSEVALRCLNTRVDKLEISADAGRPAGSAAAVVPGVNLYVPLKGLIDFDKEAGRLQKELDALKLEAERLGKKLSNHDFVTNAPAEEVTRVQDRLAESQGRIGHLQDNLSTLQRSS